MSLLLKGKADVEARDENNKTPIMQTCDPDMLKLLSSHGADLNAKIAGNTRLFSAWYDNNNSLGMVNALLQSGADITVRNQNGQTAVEYGRELLEECFTTSDRKEIETFVILEKAYGLSAADVERGEEPTPFTVMPCSFSSD